MNDVTQILEAAGRGDPHAAEEVLPIGYDEILALDRALTRLAGEDADAAQVVQLHFFAGLPIEQVAEAVGVSRATAYRHWSYARAWLRCAIEKGNAAD